MDAILVVGLSDQLGWRESVFGCDLVDEPPDVLVAWSLDLSASLLDECVNNENPVLRVEFVC